MATNVLPTIPWNLLDLPAGIVPMLKVTQDDECNLMNDWPNDDMVCQIFMLIKQCIHLTMRTWLNGSAQL